MKKRISLFEIFLSLLLFNYVISKSSVIIHYPNSIFISDSNWREMKPIYDSKLTKSDEYLRVGRSQDREDVWIYENWFYGMTNGTILESGALNGETFSNSLMFERFSSWFTIHIEADPKNFHGLKQSRTNSLNIHAALCSEPKVLHFTQDQNNAINGFIEFMNPMFVQMWHPKLHQNPELIQNLPTILCLPVKNLLKEIQVKHIDVWMLDVEGAELDVLKGVDWNQVSISTIVMECDSRGNDKDKLKTDLLVANDYICKVIERNCFCRHKSFQPSVSPPEKMQWKSLRLKEGANPEYLGQFT